MNEVKDSEHSLWNRSFLPLFVFLFGLVPSFLLFFWIQQNMTFPWFDYDAFQVDIPFATLFGSTGFDLLLIALFGTIHSFTAGRTKRPAYVLITGISCIVLFVFWQLSGFAIWEIIETRWIAESISAALFITFMISAGFVMTRIEKPFVFVGLVPRPEAESIPFHPDGPYAYVRHPGYTLTLLAWILTPTMSSDRFVFIFGMSAYLYFGIRIEEKKLSARFGKVYDDYRLGTPMLIPRFFKLRKRK